MAKIHITMTAENTTIQNIIGKWWYKCIKLEVTAFKQLHPRVPRLLQRGAGELNRYELAFRICLVLFLFIIDSPNSRDSLKHFWTLLVKTGSRLKIEDSKRQLIKLLALLLA